MTIVDGSLVVLEACHGHLDAVVVRRAWVHLAVHGVVAVVGQALVCPPSLAITPPTTSNQLVQPFATGFAA